MNSTWVSCEYWKNTTCCNVRYATKFVKHPGSVKDGKWDVSGTRTDHSKRNDVDSAKEWVRIESPKEASYKIVANY